MRTYEVKELSRMVDVVTGVFCDCCGKDIATPETEEGGCIAGLHISACFGYHSTHDTEQVETDLCDECCECIVAGFKHKPKITHYL